MSSGSGPAWWYDFLKARKVPNIRVWWSLGIRESTANPLCLYPGGAPWGDWVNGNGRKFDVGVLQINVVHLSGIRAMFGPSVDMRVMLDPEKCLTYAISLTDGGKDFSDWGLVVTSSGYRFDWSAYPDAWVQANAASSEAGFKAAWDLFPKYAAAVPGTSTTAPSLPVIQLSYVMPGKQNGDVLIVQKALARAVGLNYSSGPGVFGPRTQAAYAKWQRSLGYTGADADGIPGRQSLAALGKRFGFSVA